MKKLLIGGLVVVVAVGVGVAVAQIRSDDTEPPAEPAKNKQQETPDTPEFPFINLQSVVDGWAGDQTGLEPNGTNRASVMIYDLKNNRPSGQLNPDGQYFAASIYKLYVAYIGYQQVADGTYSFNEPYLTGKTRGQCLDEMIRTSDSPCAETMWSELGKARLTNLLANEYGLKNTDMEGLHTTAADAAVVLENIWQKEGISQEHRKLILESMKQQIHRDALPSAFPDNVTVYTKVGFSEHQDYHDTAIITLPAKNNAGGVAERAYVLSVMTRGIGTANIQDLAQRLYDEVKSK